jgi:hypothetical protein
MGEVYHEEAPPNSRTPGQGPGRPVTVDRRAIDEDIEIDDGDAAAVVVPAACSGTRGEYGWVVHVLAGLRCRVRRRIRGRHDWAVEEHEAVPRWLPCRDSVRCRTGCGNRAPCRRAHE